MAQVYEVKMFNDKSLLESKENVFSVKIHPKKLEALGKYIVEFNNLTELNIEGDGMYLITPPNSEKPVILPNQLTSVEGFYQFFPDLSDSKKLKVLHLNIPIKILPNNVAKLSSMEYLKVNYYDFEDFDKEVSVLKSLPNLKLIDLQGSILSNKEKLSLSKYLTIMDLKFGDN